MAYEEYDYYNEPAGGSLSLKDSLYQILHGLQNPQHLRETGEGIGRVRQALPGVTESVARGAIAAVPGVVGDISEFAREYAPEAMELKFGKNRVFPTTREILNYVPRMTPTHEGATTLEDVSSFISPGIGGITKDIAKLTKGLPIGATIQDVSKAIPSVEVKGITQSEIDALGFHSPLENAILSIKQPKGTGDQFLKQLEKTPGVKTEELEVTGVKQYLLDHPTVTKQELQDYMVKGRVQLENKVLGKQEEIPNNEADYQLQGGDVYHDQDYIDSLAKDLHYDLKTDEVIRNQERQALLESDPELFANNPLKLEDAIDDVLEIQAKQSAHDMYYEDPVRHHYDDYGYDIYGNENQGYVVRGPDGQRVDLGNNLYDIADITHELRMHHLDRDILDFVGNEENFAKHEKWSLPGKYENYREVLTTIPENIAGEMRGNKRFNELSRKIGELKATPEEHQEFGKLVDEGRRKEFESSHYDEPNILAHTRLNDRIINGKKTLMVEEIQSDWHQAGRKKGYDTPEIRQKIKDERQKLLDQKEHFSELAEPYAALGQDSPREIVDGWTRAANGLQELQQIENMMRSAVPNAPFKKNWHEMMMKQILNEAVKGNYDAVAFTTGRQQVERYQNALRQAVDKIEFSKGYPNADTITIVADKGGRNTFEGTAENGKFIDGPGKGKTVEEVLGKGIAKQIEEHPGGKLGTIEGKDLTIGGEGMKGFYDKILPEYINKYGKKYGIAVKKTNLEHPTGIFKPAEVDEMLKNNNLTREEFNKLTAKEKNEIWKSAPKGDEVHYFDLTDMVKKDIKEKGQPLFSGIGLAAPALMPEDQDKTGR